MHTEENAMKIIKVLASRWLTNLNQSAEDTMRAISAVLLDTTSEKPYDPMQSQAEAWFAVWNALCEHAPELVHVEPAEPAMDRAVQVIKTLAAQYRQERMNYPAVVVGLDVRFDQTGRQENVEQNGNDGLPYCECHTCIAEKGMTGPGGLLPLSSAKMILCAICGNKRCPHAYNHRNECTNSNEPGQQGTYDHLPHGLTWDDAPEWANVLICNDQATNFVWAADFADEARAQAAATFGDFQFNNNKINLVPAHAWSIVAWRPKTPRAPE